MSTFDQKRKKIRFFHNFGLFIAFEVKTEKLLEDKLCVLSDKSKHHRHALRVVVHLESCQS
jgi:hypothetical protein